jgi:hypothetical protein
LLELGFGFGWCGLNLGFGLSIYILSLTLIPFILRFCLEPPPLGLILEEGEEELERGGQPSSSPLFFFEFEASFSCLVASLSMVLMFRFGLP